MAWHNLVKIQELHYSIIQESRDFEMSVNTDLFSDYRSPGVWQPNIGIGFINGIDNSKEYAMSSVDYIHSLAQGYSVDLFYNQTNGFYYDLLEAMVCVDVDIFSKEVNQLKEAWNQFDEMNRGNLDAKFLQICHSQGGAYVKKALEESSQEIRNRVIVVNIAVATIIPSRLCHQSYNYASENDYLNLGEMLKAYNPHLTIGLKQWAQMIKYRDEIIWLEGSSGPWWVPEILYQFFYMHHDFRDPVFQQVIADHITDYLSLSA